jgi:GABA(A) receptor-associated protein
MSAIIKSVSEAEAPNKMPKTYVPYNKSHSLAERKIESAKIRAKYPDRIPVIVERLEKSNVPEIDKHKFLTPADLTMGQFVFVIRKRMKLPADQALFIFVGGNVLPPASALIADVYKEHAGEDGFLEIFYSGESTFGAAQ